VDKGSAATEAPAPAPALPGAAGLRRDAQGRRTLSILGAGDVLVHPEITEQARTDARRAGRPEGFDFTSMLDGVTPAISRADLALCHMETPLAEPSGPFQGFPKFDVPPQVLDGVRATGFDGCSTASNHTLDQGEQGVARTIKAFDAAKLGHTGSAVSAADAARPKIYLVGGVKVAHLAYSLHFNGLTRPAGKLWLANLIEPPKILAAARKARLAGAEIVVLSLHWGTEYQHFPNSDQETWAKQLIKSADIDLILGHHAHVVQPIERAGDKWVVFGMGNELARHAEPINDNREGVMARFTFTEIGPKRWKATLAEAIPTWMDMNPDLRLVDLSAALADPSTPDIRRRIYQAAYGRITGYLLSRGGGPAGLVVVKPGG
jgi:hypothetical protein